MPDAKTIIIIALLLYGAFWYNNPDDGKQYIDQGIAKVKTTMDEFQGTAVECSPNYDPVCVAGVTFDNACMAQAAGYVNLTLGLCP